MRKQQAEPERYSYFLYRAMWLYNCASHSMSILLLCKFSINRENNDIATTEERII